MSKATKWNERKLPMRVNVLKVTKKAKIRTEPKGTQRRLKKIKSNTHYQRRSQSARKWKNTTVRPYLKDYSPNEKKTNHARIRKKRLGRTSKRVMLKRQRMESTTGRQLASRRREENH